MILFNWNALFRKLSDTELIWVLRLGIAVEAVLTGLMIGYAIKYQLGIHGLASLMPFTFLIGFYVWHGRLKKKVKSSVT